MKPNQELYSERLNRLKKAIAMEKPDRTPYSSYTDAFLARMLGYTIGQYALNLDLSHKIMVDGYKALGEVDGVSASFSAAPLMGMNFLSRVKIPGRELPEDLFWQIDEMELMATEDYDKILDMGFQAFLQEFIPAKMNVDFALVGEIAQKSPQFNQEMRDAGYPLYYSGGGMPHPIDYLSGGRTMAKFMLDIRRMPDKVEAVMDMICEVNNEKFRKFRETAVDPLTSFMGMARGCPDFYSPKLWERFVWKYIKKMTETVMEAGGVTNFHIDANWDRGLDYFKEFSRGTCVFETDGTSDICLIKEKLGDTMCIKGDVQPAKLTLSTPEEIYDYSRQLINDMGPGFILSSGCGMPPNAKVENVKAMIAAATGK